MFHLTKEQTEQALVTVSNAVELGTNIIQSILGEDLSTNVHGSPLKRASIQQMLVERIRLTLQRKGI